MSRGVVGAGADDAAGGDCGRVCPGGGKILDDFVWSICCGLHILTWKTPKHLLIVCNRSVINVHIFVKFNKKRGRIKSMEAHFESNRYLHTFDA